MTVRRPGAAAVAVVSLLCWAAALGADEPLAVPVAGSLQNPAFSPDGSRLLLTAFESGYNVGPSGLWTFDLGAGTSRALSAAPDSDSVNLPGSSWNGPTARVVFSSDRVAREEIWTVAASGSGAYRVTAHSGSAGYFEPSFSPGGDWIVFEARAGAGRGSLWKIRSDGTGLVRLTDGPANGSDDREPNWSPLGDRIVFQRRFDGADWDLWTIAPDGSGAAALTTAAGDDTDPSWSPDGRWVVYSSDTGLALGKHWAIPAAGGPPERFTFAAGRYDGAPSWSPDGRWVVFESSTGEPGGTNGTGLRRTDAPNLLFADGFEMGDLSAWSSTRP